ncbi:acylneuraminate cytidylyltransferase family protein [Allosphingosinicella deserti]|uniref:CMP-N-acetylneuraminic acid synthetase n=1 Tax=Allosphingosinicella deserti TaxID=2116704 RepID=A0A2P7QUN4_9SPHN|nr:CMP-N-acetylneuraminic acid synthetase [Sphingomonas deserti]PSJ41683.1 CMP-N-acetylneuraminic acid synthetase [Sphingomonas deserti]
MNIAALMIGRGGSSLKDKNILPVLGVPLLHWAAGAARRSRHITRFYVSSDCDRILETAAAAGYVPISRPPELATATAQSTDAVRHAFPIMERDGPVDILVVQHANVGTITEQQIDACIALLLAHPEATAVVPAHQQPEYHPMRAKRLRSDGSLEPFVPGDVSANRQDLPTAFFFDHSFWVLRGRQAIFDPEGQAPWPCMGSRILPFETEGCKDVHDPADLETTAVWITANGIEAPTFGGAFDPSCD